MYKNYDEIGPEKILQVYDPKTGMIGITVIDNTALGPAKGGIRMMPGVSLEEVAKLARAMSLKNALAELPFGGGKSGIIANSKELTPEQKDKVVAAFGKAIREICPSKYVAAPDMYMAEHEMEILAKANGSYQSCTGKPKDFCEGYSCGIPHELGSTGYGVVQATKTAVEYLGDSIKGKTFSIDGFGNVGMFAAKFLTEMGAVLVAASDSKGAVYNPEGLNYISVEAHKSERNPIHTFSGGKEITKEELIELEVDVLITASVPDVICVNNQDKIKAKIIVEGSNIPMTHEVEEYLTKKGIMIIPDIIANAGGVISSYVEYIGGSSEEVFPIIERKIVKNTKLILDRAKEKNISTRKASIEISTERIKKAKRTIL